MSDVVVTGGAGFYGSAVVRHFQKVGAEVFVPRSAEFDLRTEAGVRALLYTAKPDTVVHLAAAVGGIGVNQAEPGRFFYENAKMGTELMEQARLCGVRKFVTVGTACEYAEHTPTPFREDALWDGFPTPVTAPYGLAKKMLLVQAQAYRDQYDFDSIHLIPTNLYGPGDNFDLDTGHVVPALIRKFSEAKRDGASFVTLWGTGKATRDFLFIEDAARAVVLATLEYSGRDPVNIGTEVETSIEELAENVALLTEYEGDIEWDTSKPDGQMHRRLDVTRAWEEFGFRASTPLHEGLHKTVRWYQEFVA